jgi:plasmid maintenance system antidote protein VapI
MKQIVKILEAAMKDNSNVAVAEALGMSEDDFQLVLDGSMEVSPALAMKIEQVLGIDAHDLLAAQTADQLAALGHQRIEKATKATKTVKATGTDGRPSQSPMTRERRTTTMTFSDNVSVDKAQRSVAAVARILAE